jgi:hypothetical protein
VYENSYNGRNDCISRNGRNACNMQGALVRQQMAALCALTAMVANACNMQGALVRSARHAVDDVGAVGAVVARSSCRRWCERTGNSSSGVASCREAWVAMLDERQWKFLQGVCKAP